MRRAYRGGLCVGRCGNVCVIPFWNVQISFTMLNNVLSQLDKALIKLYKLNKDLRKLPLT